MSEAVTSAFPVYNEDDTEAVIVCTVSKDGTISVDVAAIEWAEED